MNRHQRRKAEKKASKGGSSMKASPPPSSLPSDMDERQENETPEPQPTPQEGEAPEGDAGGGDVSGIQQQAKSLMNSGAGDQPAPPESQSIQDPVLKQAELKIESQLLPKYKQAYTKVVVVGMKLALANDGFIMRSIDKSQDPVIDCARGAVNLVLIMFKESRNTMPPQALVPAAMTLMIKALDFCDRSGVVKVGAPELDKASLELSNFLLHRWNLTPQKMQVLAEHVHRVMADPDQVEILSRRAGVTRDPRTLTMPQGQPAPAPTAPAGGRPQGGP